MDAAAIQKNCAKIHNNISKVIIGKAIEINLILSALLSGGHVLIEDNPGTGKTMLALALAKSFDLNFGRVQFTPDLLPQELTGFNFYSPKTGDFTFRKGALFTNILLADEINRATPRTQSGLLESMQESQITVDGVTYPLDTPYFVIATCNPIETQGTYPLPEAQLDRFLIRLSLGYPTTDESVTMLRRLQGKSDDPLLVLEPVASKAILLEMRKSADDVFIHDDILNYIVGLTEMTRNNERVRLGVSSRGAIAATRMAKAYAAVNGRGFVTPDDVKTVLPYVFSHRMIVGYSRNAADIIDEILSGVTVPTERWEK